MHPMFVGLFIKTHADDLLPAKDRRAGRAGLCVPGRRCSSSLPSVSGNGRDP
jgi:hypothetical protein